MAHKPYFITPAWRAVFHDLGADTGNVLRRARLPGDLLTHDQVALTSEEFFRLWQGLDDELDDPLFPLRLGMTRSIETFDPLLFAACCSQHLNQALPRIAKYKRLIADLIMHIDAQDDRTTLRVERRDKTLEPPTSLLTVELVHFVQLARSATRHRVVPLRLESPRPPEPAAPYAEYFGIDVSPGPEVLVVFSPEDAVRPFLTASESLWQFFEPSLNKRLADLTESSSTEERVKAALLELLPTGTASLATVAARFGVSSRTLRRRLNEEGQTFQAILDSTRESLAKHYLKTTRMSGAEIAFMLGYEDPNSFFRAFNSWTGSTPERTRRALAKSA